EVCVPLEPVQVRGKLRRRNREFFDVIEPAAVHLPGRAMDARVFTFLGVESIVERHEVERGADPADAHDHVEPAQQQVHPFAEEDVHDVVSALIPGDGAKRRRPGTHIPPTMSIESLAKMGPGSRCARPGCQPAPHIAGSLSSMSLTYKPMPRI